MKWILLILIVLLGLHNVNAGTPFPKDSYPPSCIGASMQGKAAPTVKSGPCIYFNAKGIDSIVIYFYKEYVFNYVNILRYTIKPDLQGMDTVQFPYLNSTAIIQCFAIYQNGDYATFFNYIVSPQDRINMQVVNKEGKIDLEFSGTGAEKYKTRYLLGLGYDKSAVERSELLRQLDNKTPQSEYIETHIKLYKDAQKKMMDMLNAHRSGLSAMEYEAMRCNTLCALRFNLILFDYYKRATTKEDSLQAMLLYRKYRQQMPIFSDKISLLCPEYVAILLEEENLEMFYRNDCRPYSYLALYNQLKKKYSGILRENLLASWIILPSYFSIGKDTKEDSCYFECVQDALNWVKSPVVRGLISKMVLIKKGAVAFDFTLADSTNQLFHLHDMKGKVVLLDIWGIGCMPCAEFSQRFEKEIYPAIAEKDLFYYVSVCDEVEKKKWIKSISNNTYTYPHNINVYTDGLGYDHPLIKYYNVIHIPFLLLIDKEGRVMAKLEPDTPSETIMSLITECLNKDSGN